MDARQQFLDQFTNKSEAESKWLQEVFSFINQHLFPLVSGLTRPATDARVTGGGVCCQELGKRLVSKIEESMCVSHTLPVSYRLISISELVSQQHLPCVSNLSWSTSQQRAWVKEAELSLPGQQALQRVHLLLTGCLEEGPVGGWRLRDASGSVRCECVSFSPLWLHRPVFLPHWNYIPSAPGQQQKEDGGHVELIGPPVILSAAPDRSVALVRAAGVREAASCLSSRSCGQRLSVYGHVASVCSLLLVRGTSFFFFSLTDDAHSLPVLVKESSRLWWSECLCVGDRVCVTSLRVCVLRGWKGHSILAVTDCSEIHTNYSQARGEDSCAGSQRDTPPPSVPGSHVDDGAKESHPQRNSTQTDSRVKQSRIINYQGAVTEVVSAGAGLYVMDGEVALCLAYQPSLRRELRVGDSVQIHHVHFLYRPSPDFPRGVLCTCLHSTLKVTSFSRVCGPSAGSSCPGDGVLPRLVLEKNLGVCDYLWLCHLSSQLSRSLAPSMLKKCVCMLSWKLMAFVCRRERGEKERRDIYSEMLEKPHTCPLTQYAVEPARPQYVSLSELSQSLRSGCWSSLSLSSLLPDGGSGLIRSQINATLAWSFSVHTGSRLRQRPLLLVGILELPSQTSELALQLRDATAAVACVLTETSHGDEEGQRAIFNTAWIGCLVCVVEFTVVTERFIQSDFPSYQHLDQDQFITHKSCRVYLQFSLDHVHILSPSVAMGTHLTQRGRGSSDRSERMEGMNEEETGGQKKRKLEEPPTGPPSAVLSTCPSGGRQCVSMVIRVEHKEGVSWRNAGVGLKEGQVGLVLCFSVRAAVTGPVVTWRQDPRNTPALEKETEKERKVVLVFSGTSAGWFPVIQPGSSYRLVATNTQDPCVLIGSGVSAQSGAELYARSTLQVKPDWRFYTLTKSSLLPVHRQVPSATVLSVSEVLECSRDLVCFQALVCDRISVKDGFSDSGDEHKGVCLTVCDQSGRSLRVYLDVKNTPYPLGLLPGNTLLFSEFQRRVSRAGSVYCSCLPVSSMAVVSLGDSSSAQPPAPMMHLGAWAGRGGPSCVVGQVKGHVVCVLCVRLQWVCSLCGGLYRQSCCSPQCRSTSPVFQSQAKLVLDDGTGEAHVWVSGAQVRPLLGLGDSQWEGLQRALRPRGQVEVYPWGQNLVCDDALLHFLMCVCSSKVVCRQLSLTCRRNNRQRSEELKRFSRGDREFMTRMIPPLQLICLHVNTA